ncbi:protein TONNEAU 1a isoform X2 [Cryptomeria japonica]|uniref:protein TONNEAU 1a isoform X2 n=1 Tax=Cryptomeria japonica TaxID=3369 RepID=UPI0025AC9E5F|nr:protein TONNEAU 1a isoform X2 [Cryptomeria japonica]
MDDYMREMMDLKTLVTRSLEKKGILAKLRAELRASVFEAIEDEDHALENEEGAVPALLGSCNDKAKQLHTSPSGKLLTALICEYLEWAQLGHTLKVYLPECNLPKGFWKSELREKFGSKVDADSNNDGDNGPLLLEVLETYLNREQQNDSGNFPMSNARRSATEGASTSSPDDSSSNIERHTRKHLTSLAGGLPPLSRLTPAAQFSSGSLRNSSLGNVSDRMSDVNSSDLFDIGTNHKTSSNIPFAGTSRENGSFPATRKEDNGWRYGDDQHSDDIIRASNAMENIQLDRKARSLTSSWRNIDDGIREDDSQSERDTF